MEIEVLVQRQRDWFRLGKTRSVSWRLGALKTLQREIQSRREEIEAALRQDLGKSGFETYMCETGLVLTELSYMIRHLKGFARRRLVATPLAQFPSVSFTSPEPYGVALVMSPWNYPFMLCMEPVIGAIAAGNCVVIKPSAYAPATSAAVAELIRACFSPHFVAVVEGGREENARLLEQRFDFIFFTGSVSVGKLVLEKAAKHVTPVVLELGGKSPCIVDRSADIRMAARRIVFGKFLNLGQTCVAPDYVFVQEEAAGRLLQEMERCIAEQFGPDPLKNKDYGHIVNEKHFRRLLGLLEQEKVYTGGGYDPETLQIAPTILTDVSPTSPVMRQEIFGPILPVMTFKDLSEVISFVTAREKPLALYLFTRSRSAQRRILDSVSFGGGCINDTVIHLATPYMGFGGVGGSGMGSYHGRDSFETFSHRRSILKKSTMIDLPIRYQPYCGWKRRLLELFLR